MVACLSTVSLQIACEFKRGDRTCPAVFRAVGITTSARHSNTAPHNMLQVIYSYIDFDASEYASSNITLNWAHNCGIYAFHVVKLVVMCL